MNRFLFSALNSHQINAISKDLRLHIRFIFTERFQANGAASSAGIVVGRNCGPQILINHIEGAIDLALVFFLVAVLSQTLHYISFEHVDLVIIKSLRRREFKPWWTFWELTTEHD